ncbi:MAG: nitrogenase molybdenum-iron protein subunit alpha [Rivularia sp. (in: Bacteria)]|nr:nitrogenase molybdenum-iron protein subunit alpha [Rivularia sp. MS3]
MDLAINNPSWKLIGTPWKNEEPAATTQAAKAKAAA